MSKYQKRVNKRLRARYDSAVWGGNWTEAYRLAKIIIRNDSADNKSQKIEKNVRKSLDIGDEKCYNKYAGKGRMDAEGDFNDEDHPRDSKTGQFTKKGSGGDSGSSNKGKRNGPTSGTAAKKDCTLKNSSKEAQAAYDRARASEPKITDDMCEIAESVGAEMYGLDFSVKTASSVENKIERKRADAQKRGEDFNDEDAVKAMGDLVRYTMMSPHDKIAETAQTTIETLTKKGYDVIEVDNKYIGQDRPTYKGLHINAVSPDGQSFELQIHSQTSMAVKEKNHVLYEEWRDVRTSDARKAELNEQMIKNTASISQPKGIEGIKSYKK